MKLFIILSSLVSFNLMAAGGISGGGGNLITPSRPVTIQDPREVRHIILGTTNLLRKFINAQYILYNAGSMDYNTERMYSILFSHDEDNLHNVMEEISLDIPLDRLCFDQFGTAFDGSTYNQSKHSICISAFSIAKKCNQTEIPIQATALIMHEYSEVVGLSDEDAIVLQNQVITELNKW